MKTLRLVSVKTYDSFIIDKKGDERQLVKVTVAFHEKLENHLVKSVLNTDSEKVERAFAMEGRSMTVILSPGKQPRKEKNAETENR